MGLGKALRKVVEKTQGEGKASSGGDRCWHLAGVSANYMDLREMGNPRLSTDFTYLSRMSPVFLPVHLSLGFSLTPEPERNAAIIAAQLDFGPEVVQLAVWLPFTAAPPKTEVVCRKLLNTSWV